MPAPQTEVLITVDGREHARHVLVPGDYVIGRGAECHIPVDAASVSGTHAKLILKYDHGLIEDLGSSNGTCVNGQPIPKAERVRLWPNQKIQVGAATIELRRLQSDAPSDMSLAPAQRALRAVLPSELLREKKYEIGGVVARGGMGAILDAREATTERTIAMKVMLDTADTDGLLRFLDEAKITAQLEHPNIVPVHELSVDENGQPFYTMKMVRGITLKKVLELLAEAVPDTVKKYPLPVLITVFQKVCDALAFAHSKGVIHRDLKPENIMLGDYGEALVMDWGLAKRVGNGEIRRTNDKGNPTHLSSAIRDSSFSGTLAGTILGTPQFMSPEQARGEVDGLDARSDIYSLGAILYQILSLRVPVNGTDAWEIVGKVSRGEIDPLVGPTRRGGPDQIPADDPASAPRSRPGSMGASGGRALPRAIPASLAAVVRKAMSLGKDARYASVGDLQADILAYQNGFATSAENAGLGKQLILAIKRHKAASIGIATVLIVGSVLGTKAIIEGKRAERGEAQAKSEAARAERGEAKANAALAELKKAAPELRQLAETEASHLRFESALQKLDAALAIDPSHLPGYWRRAWLLVGMDRFPEAAEAIRVAQEKDSANAKLAAILPVIEQLAAAPAAERWTQSRASVLLSHLQTVKASNEVQALSAKFQLGAAAKLKLVQERVKNWGSGYYAKPTQTGGISVSGLPGKFDSVEPLRGLPIMDLSLAHTGVKDLEPLRGMPLRKLDLLKAQVSDLSPLRGMLLEELELTETFVSDLSPLEGMPLRKLRASGLKVSDLRPLRGMPLEFLNLEVVGTVRDVSPLRGMPLRVLNLDRTNVSDLSPLEGMPLRVLNLSQTKVTDLAPLKGMPLEELRLDVGRSYDCSPLRGMPLKTLKLNTADFSPLAGMKLGYLMASSAVGFSTLRGLTVEHLEFFGSGPSDLTLIIGLKVKRLALSYSKTYDLSPLLECTELEQLTAMNCPAQIEPLRAHKTLKVISYSSPGTQGFIERPVEQFWKEYDAQVAAGKK